jgi:hypothetical protein
MGTEYNYNSNSGVIEFKHTYLKTLAEGNHVYTVQTTSGAKGTFTITVENSTPVASDVVYEKSEGGDLQVAIDVKGKEILSVVIGEFELVADEYAYADGVLTIAESAIATLAAGEYSVVITTSASVSIKLTINDAPPAFAGEYTATVNKDLAVTVETYGKAIISVSIDDIELLEGEYTYENGVLTIGGAVFAEFAEGERVLTLVTEGGTAQVTFTLAAQSADSSVELKSCKTSLSGTGVMAMLAMAVVAIFKKRK